jgi:ESCRT-I complex subunit VPS28
MSHPTMSTTISLDEEVRLYSTNAEREKYSTLATLFGIIIALDYLERAYVRDSITAAECVFLGFLVDISSY